MIEPVEFFQVIDLTVLVWNIVIETSSQRRQLPMARNMDSTPHSNAVSGTVFLRMSCGILDTIRCHLLPLDGDNMNK